MCHGPRTSTTSRARIPGTLCWSGRLAVGWKTSGGKQHQPLKPHHAPCNGHVPVCTQPCARRRRVSTLRCLSCAAMTPDTQTGTWKFHFLRDRFDLGLAGLTWSLAGPDRQGYAANSPRESSDCTSIGLATYLRPVSLSFALHRPSTKPSWPSRCVRVSSRSLPSSRQAPEGPLRNARRAELFRSVTLLPRDPRV